jgi:hypothetical protein
MSSEDRDVIIHEELGRLPEKFRTAVLLCDLEGLTQQDAACQLGWPAGTVRSRLARGREQLRKRLTRRGLGPSAILGGSPTLINCKSASLVETTVEVALGLGSGQGIIPSTASAIALTEGVLKTMFWNKLKTHVAIVLAGALLCGTALVSHRAMGRAQAPAPAAGEQPAEPNRPAGKQSTTVLSDLELPDLAALTRNRLRVAQELRDTAAKLYREGETSLVDYLTWQKRYDDIVAEVTVKTDADRLRFLEHRVALLKQIEDTTRKGHASGSARTFDVLVAELARLDAEEALAQTVAKSRGRAK